MTNFEKGSVGIAVVHSWCPVGGFVGRDFTRSAVAVDQCIESGIDTDVGSSNDTVGMRSKSARIDKRINSSSLNDGALYTPEGVGSAEEQGRNGRKGRDEEHTNGVAW